MLPWFGSLPSGRWPPALGRAPPPLASTPTLGFARPVYARPWFSLALACPGSLRLLRPDGAVDVRPRDGELGPRRADRADGGLECRSATWISSRWGPAPATSPRPPAASAAPPPAGGGPWRARRRPRGEVAAGPGRRAAMERAPRRRLRRRKDSRRRWRRREVEIATWIKAFWHTIKVGLSTEHDLCTRIFAGRHATVGRGIFTDLARCVMLHMLNFTEAVAMTKRAAEKLFKVLDMYEAIRDASPVIDAFLASSATQAGVAGGAMKPGAHEGAGGGSTKDEQREAAL